nr:DUF3054 domain-containing protein [Klugiella xanthotipulae]
MAGAFLLDLVLVVIFVLIGRRSHAESFDVLGALNAIWPFVSGMLVGWLISRAWRAPLGILNPGVIVWLCTVAGGMLLRVASGQGVQLSFVIVASVATALFLLGWRLVALFAVRRRRA